MGKMKTIKINGKEWEVVQVLKNLEGGHTLAALSRTNELGHRENVIICGNVEVPEALSGYWEQEFQRIEKLIKELSVGAR